MKTVAFFNNNASIAKTTLAYHVAHMLVEAGQRVLLVDFDPQSKLSTMCLSEERLEQLWLGEPRRPQTLAGWVQRLLHDIDGPGEVPVEELVPGLGLVPGNFTLSSFEGELASAWLHALDHDAATIRALTIFHRVTQLAAAHHGADIVFFDIGPNLGSINRTALLASDFVLAPLAPDLFSVQGLRSLGPTLTDWRTTWAEHRSRSSTGNVDLPEGKMVPLGYVLMQSGMQLTHPVRDYDRWVRRLPAEFHQSLLGDNSAPPNLEEDSWYLGIMRHYQSLLPLAADARKPMFQLRPGDGAIGSQMYAVSRCRIDFEELSTRILMQIER